MNKGGTAAYYEVNSNFFTEENMKRIFECTTCGYLYDESVGDAEGDIDAGTEFEDLGVSWVCPICSAPKSDFELLGGECEEEL